MAHDITKDVIGCKEFEVQKLNQSGEPAKFYGSITDDNDLVNKKYVDDADDLLVPYTGATGDVDLGAYDLTATDLNADYTYTDILVSKSGGNIIVGSTLDLSDGYDITNVLDFDMTGDLTINGDGNKIIFENLDIYSYKGSLTLPDIFIGEGSGKVTSRSGTGGNIGIGSSTLDALTTGLENTGIGYSALSGVTEGNRNTGVGAFSLFRVTTGDSNFGMGFGAGQYITTGNQNLAIGTSALSNADTSSSNNVALGANSLFTATGTVVINSNVGIGTDTGKFIENGADDNVFIGGSAGAFVTTGSENVIVGRNAGTTLTTGNTNILIGYDAEPLSATGDNQITIGNNITGNHDDSRLSFTYLGADTTDCVEFKADGEINLHGTARVYKNIFIRPSAFGVGGAAPASCTVNSSGFAICEFANSADDYAQLNFNVPSDMDVTEDCQIRITWSAPNTSANMTWGYGYCICSENDDTEGTPTTGSTVVTSSATADGKTSDTLFTISGDTLSQGDLIQVYFYRDVSEDTYSNDVDVHGLALKYVANKLGGAT